MVCSTLNTTERSLGEEGKPMQRCNELCTKEMTGACALCEALAERDRFLRFWFQAGWFIDSVRALKRGMMRLRDRSKAPLCWWYPVPHRDWEVRHQDVVREAHKQYAETINKVMFTLLGVALFCLLMVLSSSDHKLLLATDSTITVPVANAPLSFVGFLVVAPFLLLVLTVYLHIFFGYWLDCERERQYLNQRLRPPIESIPTLFSFPDAVSRFLTGGIFYWLVPVVLGVITWKAWADRTMGLLLTCVSGFVTIALVFLQIRRRPDNQRTWWTRLGYTILILIIGLMVLATCIPKSFQRSLNFISAELPNASFVRKNLSRSDASFANLQGANFQEAILQDAILQQALLREAKLQGADLQRADLQRADLQGANLREANLREADLGRANLQEANPQADLGRAKLQGANLGKAKLPEANLQGANLLQATLREANLSHAFLPEANLQWAILREADLSHAFLPGANLPEAVLPGALLPGANLPGANLPGANLRETRGLTRSQLLQARNAVLAFYSQGHLTDLYLPSDHNEKLKDKNLERYNLSGANLQQADLQGALLPGANLPGANLQGANLQGADLTETENLTQDQVDTACCDENTKLPGHLTKPLACSTQP